MRMSFGQEMRMAQKQVLAPRMIQSMEILQLPVMALEERIEEEIQNNETLEMEEAGQESSQWKERTWKVHQAASACIHTLVA
jgi:RNA polymerase sigma-54 factor